MSRTPLNKISGMPQLVNAFNGWASNITLYKRTQVIIDGLVRYGAMPSRWDEPNEYYDTQGVKWDSPIPPVTKISFRGVIQPLSPKQIALKPEGQRAWEWLQIHCLSGSLNLTTNDQIIYNGQDYKIMATNDYSLNGYIEYHLIRDYQNPPKVEFSDE